jgi:hypothetical protein
MSNTIYKYETFKVINWRAREAIDIAIAKGKLDHIEAITSAMIDVLEYHNLVDEVFATMRIQNMVTQLLREVPNE